MLNLVGSDREFLLISFWDISSAYCGLWNAPVLQCCRAEHLEVASSWWRSSGLRQRPVAIGDNFGWIHFLSRDVHKRSGQFLDSNKEGILSFALLELFRIARTTLHCPFHESSFLILHWMGCRHYFVVDRLEDLVDEDDSRSSGRAREHWNFRLISQLNLTIQIFWSRCWTLRTNGLVVQSQVSPCLFDLRKSVQSQVSPVLVWSA